MSDIANVEHELFIDGGKVVQRLVLSRRPDGTAGEVTTRTICDEGAEMALCYDRSDGTAHKLGPREVIEAWAETLRAGLRRVADLQAAKSRPGVADPEDIMVVSFLATPESMRAATDCWARTGSSREFADAFGQAEAAAPGGPRH